MKTLALFVSLLLTAAAAGCRDDGSQVTNPTATGAKLIVRSGTSFGMCAGYCLRDLRVDSTDLLYTKRSWGRGSSTLPDSLLADTITPLRWAALKETVAAKYEAFSKLDTIIGCPDCADGGAEWIEIEQGATVRRVTFEYGKEIPEIKELIAIVREIRGKFEE